MIIFFGPLAVAIFALVLGAGRFGGVTVLCTIFAALFTFVFLCSWVDGDLPQLTLAMALLTVGSVFLAIVGRKTRTEYLHQEWEREAALQDERMAWERSQQLRQPLRIEPRLTHRA